MDSVLMSSVSMLFFFKIERIWLICSATFCVAYCEVLAVLDAPTLTMAMSGWTETFPKPLTLMTLSSQHDSPLAPTTAELIVPIKQRVISKKVRYLEIG